MASGSKPRGGADAEVLKEGKAMNASSHSDNNSSATSEEKMKVVVRVRPLQANEEPWPKAIEADVHGPDATTPATITIQVMWSAT
ncbi:unnamed protein product [Phytophthora lilii]|uniref:Unnamed protein product n=1 Tax=Phytophthora lilii TaxID=2077276 RepID=A0A9W6U1X1_9STRA|nr:unnamed protein product [Phytophthora lilii]